MEQPLPGRVQQHLPRHKCRTRTCPDPRSLASSEFCIFSLYSASAGRNDSRFSSSDWRGSRDFASAKCSTKLQSGRSTGSVMVGVLSVRRHRSYFPLRSRAISNAVSAWMYAPGSLPTFWGSHDDSVMTVLNEPMTLSRCLSTNSLGSVFQ